MFSVYTLSDPRTQQIRYVGVTTLTIKARLASHLKSMNSKHTSHYPLYRWIRQLKAVQLQPIITLIECDMFIDREIYWIRYYRSLYADLLNCTDGGEGLFNPSIEVRQKIGAGHRGKIVLPASRVRMRLSHLGQTLPEAQREKIRQAHLARPPRSPAWCANIAKVKRGKKRPAEMVARLSAMFKGRTHPGRKKPPPFTAEHRAKIGAASRGNHYALGMKRPPRTAEHSRQLSLANMGQRLHEASAKVTIAEVIAIRVRYAQGDITYKELAAEYAHTGIRASGVGSIIRGETWCHVPSPQIVASAG